MSIFDQQFIEISRQLARQLEVPYEHYTGMTGVNVVKWLSSSRVLIAMPPAV